MKPITKDNFKDRKFRTRDGREVVIYAVHDGQDYPIHGAIKYKDGFGPESFDDDGRYCTAECNDFDLVEITQYDDFKIDDKVLVWNTDYINKKSKRHFAGVSCIGEPMTFRDGTSSFTAQDEHDVVYWDFCEKYVESDL